MNSNRIPRRSNPLSSSPNVSPCCAKLSKLLSSSAVDWPSDSSATHRKKQRQTNKKTNVSRLLMKEISPAISWCWLTITYKRLYAAKCNQSHQIAAHKNNLVLTDVWKAQEAISKVLFQSYFFWSTLVLWKVIHYIQVTGVPAWGKHMLEYSIMSTNKAERLSHVLIMSSWEVQNHWLFICPVSCLIVIIKL